MIRAVLFTTGGAFTGFTVRGHAAKDETDEQGRLLCAAVSSSVYMTANTITDVIGAKADIDVDDVAGFFDLQIRSLLVDCQPLMKGLLLHLQQLASDFPKRIEILTEVS